MISAVVLVLLTVSAAIVSVAIMRGQRLGNEVAEAAVAASQVLEGIHSTPFAAVKSVYPPDSSLPVAALEGGTVEITYDDPDAIPLIISVTVRWECSEGDTMERSFTTARME